MSLTLDHITTILTWGVGGFAVLAVFWKLLPMVFEFASGSPGDSKDLEKRLQHVEVLTARHGDLIRQIVEKQHDMEGKLDAVKETVDRSYGVLKLIKEKVFSVPRGTDD